MPMNAWLESLSRLEYAMLIIAIPATLLLVLQTLLLLFGLHHDSDTDVDTHMDGGWDVDHDPAFDHDVDFDHDGVVSLDHDFDHDGHPDGETGGEGLFGGLKLFTLRGVVAFLSIFGWGSLWLLRIHLNPLLALFLGVAMGVWAMVLVALLLRVAMRLQADGTTDPRNALGLPGSVYLTVPANRSGEGKVNVLVQEQFTEFQAVTDDAAPLPTGSEVTVVGLSGKSTLVVTHK